MRYPKERKEAVLKKMLPPQNKTIKELAEEEGICEATLYNWRNTARTEGRLMPDGDSSPNGWTARDKFCSGVGNRRIKNCSRAGAKISSVSRFLSVTFQEGKGAGRNSSTAGAVKKGRGDLGQGRGRMISISYRREIVKLIDEAVCAGARQRKACGAVSISLRTYKRWTAEGTVKIDGRTTAQRSAPINKLSRIEEKQIIETCNSPEYANLLPSQIVPAQADCGIYIASESSFYRVQRKASQLEHRGRSQKPRKIGRPESFLAEKPNQVWSWDITYLASSVKGLFYRLYMVMDIYSRKIVSWEVHTEENATHAATLIQKASIAEGIKQKQLVLHSDNGSPMKGATILAKLQQLGIMPSFSRPSVSNDNPYSESLFRTLKYTLTYPGSPFESIDAARQWVRDFVRWYNYQHHHSGLKFVTPDERHRGKDKGILEQRKAVYEAARTQHPERWSRKTRNWEPVEGVWLNPTNKNQSKNDEQLKRAA